MTYIAVRHNIEVAHRLINLKGRCENIHGHSMVVEMTLHGHLDKKGVLEGLDFAVVKGKFRTHLDTKYDHRLLLNKDDPFAGTIVLLGEESWIDPEHPELGKHSSWDLRMSTPLPGLQVVQGDPTTENLAKWISQWATNEFNLRADVHVDETQVNAAGHSSQPARSY